MKKLLLLVFTATLVLFFTPNIFAQMGKTVKVANNSELIRAMNNPNVNYVEFTTDGFYDAAMMNANAGTILVKKLGDGGSRAGCQTIIDRHNGCWIDVTTIDSATVSFAPGSSGCPAWPTANSGFGWDAVESGTTLHFDTGAMDSITNPRCLFTTDEPGVYHLTYKWNNDEEASFKVYKYTAPSITSLDAQPDTVCGDSTLISYAYDSTAIIYGDTAVVNWYVDGSIDASLASNNSASGSFYFKPGACGAYELVLSVSDVKACNEDRDTLNLYFYDKPTVDAGTDKEVCGLVVDPLGGTGDASCKAGGTVDLSWSQFTGPGTATFYDLDSAVVDQCGTYEFILTATNGDASCASTDTMQVKFYDTPVADAGTDADVCGLVYDGLAGSYTGGTCTHGGTVAEIWNMYSGPGTATFSAGNDSVTVTQCGTYTFTYKASNGLCSDVDTLVVKFYDTPVADAGTDAKVCGLIYDGLHGTFTDGICTNGGTVTEDWEFFSGPGTATFSAGNDSVTVSQCGTYTFTYKASNNLCSDVDTLVVKFFDEPVPNAGTDVEVCGTMADLGGSYTAACTNGDTVIETWTTVPPTTGVNFYGNDSVSVTSCGTYTFVYTVNLAGACSASDTVIYKFYDTPSVNAGSDQQVCGLETTLVPIFDALCENGGTATGSWSSFDGLTFDGDTASATTCGIYHAVYTVDNGPCSNSDTVELKFYEAPTADAGPDSVNVCGLEAPLNGSYTGGCTNGDTVVESWTVLSGNATVQGDTLVTVTSCGSVLLSYKVSVALCSSTDTILYKFTDYPVVTASGPGEVCGTTDANGVYIGIANLSGDFTANCTGDTTYNWSVCTTPIGGANVQWFPGNDVRNPEVHVNACGFYQFTFEVHNGPCVAVDTVSVKFYDKPVVDAGPDAEVCGDSLLLNPDWTVVCDLGGTVNATWQAVGQYPGNVTFYGDTAVQVDACGTYTFVYHVVNGACCTCDTLVAKFFDPPTVDVGLDKSICGLTMDISPVVTPTCTNGDTLTGFWYGDPGLSFSGDTLITASQCGTYQAIYQANLGPCVNRDTIEIKFFETPSVNVGPDKDVCGLTVDILPVVSAPCLNGDSIVGSWSGDPGLSFSGDTLITADTCGTYQAVYSVTLATCTNSDTVVFKFYDTPVVTAHTTDTVEICGDSTVLDPSYTIGCTNGGTVDSLWTGTGLTFNGNTAHAAVCGTYTAYYKVTNGPGCSATDSVLLKFYDTPANVDAGTGDTLCDLTAQLTGSYDVQCTNGGTVNVLWTKVNGPGTVIFADDTADTTDVTVGQCGEYQFKYEVTNGLCPASDTVSFFFTDDPVLTASTPADSVCGFSTTVNAYHTVSCGLNDTSWLSGTGPAGVTIVDNLDSTYSILVDTCGTYDFTYHATNGDCTADTTFQIVFFSTPDPEIVGDDTVFTCSTTTYTTIDPGCNGASAIQYAWNVAGGAFASGVTTATTASVDVIWDQDPGMGQLIVHTEINGLPNCGGDDTLDIWKQEPTLEGQVKYWNSVETYMPSPYSTDDYSTIPFDYFYVILAIDGANGLTDLDTAYVEPRLMEDLNELMSYFNFDLITSTYGCDAKYFLRIWDGGFVYHNDPPAPAENTTLGNNYTWNNWGGVNATDALAIQLMAANVEVSAAPYNYAWVGNTAWLPTYGYYSQGIADVNHTIGNGGNNKSGITALDALTAKYRAVGLLGAYPDNSNANNNQFRPNFMVTGRMVPSLPYITFPNPFDSLNVNDVPFTHSGNEYMYFQPATNHKYTSDSLPWGGKNNYINLYYESVGDVNASFIPPGSGLKAKSALDLEYEGLASTAIGSVITVPVSVDRDVEVGAVTLSFNYRNDLIEVLGTNYTDDDMFINQEEGILNIAWFSTEGADFNADATIAQIRVKVLAEIPEGTELFELNTISELADVNAQPIADVTLKTIGVTTDKGIFTGTELTASNFPNPSDAYTTISYTLPENGKVKVEVYNSVGMLVTTLVDETQESGVNNVKFTTGTVKAGVYFYHITVQGESNNYSAVKRMIVVH